MRYRLPAAVALSLVAVLPTAGCYQGFEGTVNSQGPTGNGTDFTVPADGGSIQVQDATVVVDPNRPDEADLIMTVINDGSVAEALVGATIEGVPATISAPVLVQPGRAASIGGPSAVATVEVTGIATQLGTYTPVAVSFRDAGTEQVNVLVVPATGYYADYAPTREIGE